MKPAIRSILTSPLRPRFDGAKGAHEKALLRGGYDRLGLMDTHAEPQGR
jgi:hypothetical protein